MKVLLLSRYSRMGASTRVRHLQYLPRLEAAGIQVTVSALLDDAYLERLYGGQRVDVAAVAAAYARRVRAVMAHRDADLVWVEKELLPWLPAWAEGLLLRGAPPLLVDYDDAWFHRYDQHPRGLVRSLLGRKIDALMRRASLVSVCNAYLAERAQRAGARRIELLPSVVDLERYPSSGRPPGGDFTVGWIGSPSTSPYLEPLRPLLARLCEQSGVRVVLVGAAGDALQGLPVERVRWDEATEVDAIRRFDVGIMPLEDGPWQRGKCGYKLIQYMACGVPVVASPVGVNPQIVGDEEGGYLAGTLPEWETAIARLRADPVLRTRLGAAGREKVARAYSLQAVAPRLIELLQAAATPPPRHGASDAQGGGQGAGR